MKPKLKFLLPDIQTATQVTKSLLLASVDTKNIIFLAKPGTELGHLLAASEIENTTIINNENNDGREILIGAVMGVIAGMYIYNTQPWIVTSMGVHWIAVATIATVIGAIAFAICAAIFGVNFYTNDLKKYKDKIDRGAILIIVTAPVKRANEIRLIVNKSYLKF